MSRKTDGFELFKSTEKRRLDTHFKDVFMSKARWEGLPPEIPKNRPMWDLWAHPCVTFFRLDEADAYFCLPIATENMIKSAYGEPSEWRAVAQGEMAGIISEKILNPSNAVLIWCNESHTAPLSFVDNIVEQMVNVELTKRLNVNAQKMPINVITSDKKVLNDLNVMKEFLEAKPTIITDRSINDRLEIVNMGVPYIGAELDDTYNTYYARILDYLGCENNDIDKKERLISAEVFKNEEQIELKHLSFMKTWQEGAEAINELFGLNVSVVDVFAEIEAEAEDDTMNEEVTE